MRDPVHGLTKSLGCTCTYEVCGKGESWYCAHTGFYKRMTLLQRICVCLKQEFDKWNNLPRLLSECEDYGTKQLQICPQELSILEQVMVKWKCFEYTVADISKETSQPKKRIKEVFKETIPTKFLNYFKLKVQSFVTHNFVANWQDAECRKMMENVLLGVFINHIDFAQIYMFAIQNGIKSMYQFSTSIAILVHIIFIKGE